VRFLAAVLPAVLLIGCPQNPATRSAGPNILLIMADDLGVEVLPSYGGTSYRTPNLDALAAAGVRFEYAFATPVCTPSRVEILTGQYPFRNGWSQMLADRPVEDRTLDTTLPSLARVLKRAGYATAVAGKWQLAHLGDTPNHLTALGFDEHCVWTHRLTADSPLSRRFWNPSVWRNGRLDASVERSDVYGPDLFVEFLIDFIERHQDERFFAYYPMTLTHRPYLKTPDMLKAPATREAGFASNVRYMDKLVGRLVATIEALGLSDDTLILFTADNGTDYRITSRLGDRSVRGGKTELNDRGASVPLIVRWPGVVSAGTMSNALVDFTDVLPTLAEVAGTSLSETSVRDGHSFAPLLRGGAFEPRRFVYVEAEGGWFLRDRMWSLDHRGTLRDVSDRFDARRVEAAEATAESRAARARLQGWLETLRSDPPH
jgi:arylsulfatase A